MSAPAAGATRHGGAPGREGATRTGVVVAHIPAHEGPVLSAAQDALYVTSLPVPRAGAEPEVAILRIPLAGGPFPVRAAEVGVVRRPAGAANGMTLDVDGALLVCEQGGPDAPSAVTRVDPLTGGRTVLVDRYAGRPLSSPNDVVVAADGAIWFTDPGYGHLQGFRPPPALPDAVYRFDRASGRLDAVSTAEDKPNGLAFSPDGRTVYVADSGAIHAPGDYDESRPHHVVAYEVVHRTLPGGAVVARLTHRRIVVEVPGFPDGLAVDATGRLYVCCDSGIHVVGPDGAPVAVLDVPGAVNLAIGAADGGTAYVTTDDAVVAVPLPPL